MAFKISKATKKTARLRLAIIGPSGSGKTYTALAIAQGLGARVMVIDTERGSASKYADRYSFEVGELDTFAPATYVEAIRACEQAGADVIVIDSLSHAWMGAGGALEMVDRAARQSNSRNSFDAWRSVTPHHNALVEAMLQCRAHLIVTMRSKTEYVLEEDSRGKKVPRKVGMAPVQREGMEYEFTVMLDVDMGHIASASKDRTGLFDGQFFKIGVETGAGLLGWLETGADVPSAAIMLAAIACADTVDALRGHYEAATRMLPESEREAVDRAKVVRYRELVPKTAPAPAPVGHLDPESYAPDGTPL